MESSLGVRQLSLTEKVEVGSVDKVRIVFMGMTYGVPGQVTLLQALEGISPLVAQRLLATLGVTCAGQRDHKNPMSFREA